MRPYWALLFTDLLLFATVSRDRVLFVTEEPVALATVSDAQFNLRKKGTKVLYIQTSLDYSFLKDYHYLDVIEEVDFY